MPQIRKGPRLWLERRAGRAPQYVILDGSRKVRTGFGPAESDGAIQALDDYRAHHFRPNTGERRLDQICCAEVIDLYLSEHAPTTSSSVTIGYHARNLLPFWADKTLADIKGATCRSYAKSRPVKPATVRRELKTLQAAIGFWKKETGLAAIPQVTLPAEGERRERVLSRDELAQLLRACRRLHLPHVARFIIIGYNTGTRHDAILKTRWAPALSGGHIDLAKSVMFRRGSAEAETSKRRPVVAIVRRLRGQLERWRVSDDEDVSHVIHFRGKPILKLKTAWHSVVAEAGLGPEVTPHVLRHTCATMLLWGRDAKGARPAVPPMTIWDVAGVIGADATTVERVYGHHRRLGALDERKRA